MLLNHVKRLLPVFCTQHLKPRTCQIKGKQFQLVRFIIGNEDSDCHPFHLFKGYCLNYMT
jgi:hypothetical protein